MYGTPWSMPASYSRAMPGTSSDARIWHSRAKRPDIPAGTVYKQVAGGGGGYGDPRKRPAERVLEETRWGYVSPEAARDVYGVAIDPDTWTIDAAATAALRDGVR